LINTPEPLNRPVEVPRLPKSARTTASRGRETRTSNQRVDGIASRERETRTSNQRVDRTASRGRETRTSSKRVDRTASRERKTRTSDQRVDSKPSYEALIGRGLRERRPRRFFDEDTALSADT
jgi:hypothetical protein